MWERAKGMDREIHPQELNRVIISLCVCRCHLSPSACGGDCGYTQNPLCLLEKGIEILGVLQEEQEARRLLGARRAKSLWCREMPSVRVVFKAWLPRVLKIHLSKIFTGHF